jgi:response regulator NasT
MDTTAVPRVVVVDDDRGLRDSMVALLEAYGVTVLGVADDGGAGIDLAGELRPEVVLMDLRMPVVDGLDATAAIRERDDAIQVVLLSAYDDPGLVESARGKGAYAYLVKGCRGARILEIVNAAATASRERRKETAQ